MSLEIPLEMVVLGKVAFDTCPQFAAKKGVPLRQSHFQDLLLPGIMGWISFSPILWGKDP